MLIELDSTWCWSYIYLRSMFTGVKCIAHLHTWYSYCSFVALPPLPLPLCSFWGFNWHESPWALCPTGSWHSGGDLFPRGEPRNSVSWWGLCLDGISNLCFPPQSMLHLACQFSLSHSRTPSLSHCGTDCFICCSHPCVSGPCISRQ